MPRWKALPETVDPQLRQLVVQLRRLKDHSGLSLKSLEAKTGYSKSSWERYLGGKSLPPRQALEELARVCAADPTRLLALHEVARACGGQGQGGPSPAVGQESHDSGERPVLPPPPSHRPARRRLLLGATAVVVVAAAAVLVTLLVTTHPWRKDMARATAPARAQPGYTCEVHRRDGRWYAGNSTTQDAVLEIGMAGPEVAEAQCLLERAGFSPGGIDGIYGNLTERAVKREQEHAKLVVDGLVGPHTWAALRG